jgi:hypothetical protein
MWRARSNQRDLFDQTTGVTTALPSDLRAKLTPLLQVLLTEAASAELRQIKVDVLGEEDSDDQHLA